MGQPVPPTALFLQDNLAVMVMEGLLDQIELMRRQHISALEQIDHAAKCKLSSPEEMVIKLKQAWQQLCDQSSVASGNTCAVYSCPYWATHVANIPQWAEAAQMLFMKAVVFLASPEQVAVVVVPTDPHTPVQYDGIVATAAAKKGKHCKAPPINDNSNYGELQSEEEEEEEEGKMPAQRFQCVQQNKEIAKKKANKAKAAAASAH
ncbi:hypothetical protein C0993_005809 [Termitomyces sp. T159_Od127]|nr:hypothetical protein C0993_005809 [Termitomyces sp. T159_Od127]